MCSYQLGIQKSSVTNLIFSPSPPPKKSFGTSPLLSPHWSPHIDLQVPNFLPATLSSHFYDVRNIPPKAPSGVVSPLHTLRCTVGMLYVILVWRRERQVYTWFTLSFLLGNFVYQPFSFGSLALLPVDSAILSSRSFEPGLRNVKLGVVVWMYGNLQRLNKVIASWRQYEFIFGGSWLVIIACRQKGK